MQLKRSALAGLVALGLVMGGSACGKAAEKVAEEAIEQNSDCENVDLSDAGASGECGGESFDVNADGDAELPEGFPADLAPPADAQITFSTSSDGNFSVIAGLDGDRASVTDGIVSQLEAAGYTIDNQSEADSGAGATSTVTATGADYTANVVVTEVENAVEGNLTVAYTLTKVA